MSKLQTPPDRFTSGWLQSLDGRTGLAVDMRMRWQSLTTDLGGEDRLSYAQRSLCERCLWLEFWLRAQEQALADGKEFDAGRWTQGCNALQGIYSKLGLERKARDVPDLSTWLASKGKESAA